MHFSAAAAVCQLLLAGVFLLSGIGKLRQKGAMEFAVLAVKLPAAWGTSPLMRLFPAAETALGAALLLFWGPWRMLPLAAAALLMAVFVALIWRALLEGTPASCNCFGKDGPPISRWTLARNLLLLAAAGWSLAAGTVSPGLLTAPEFWAAAGLGLLLGAFGLVFSRSEFSESSPESYTEKAAASVTGPRNERITRTDSEAAAGGGEPEDGVPVRAESGAEEQAAEEEDYERLPNPPVRLERVSGEGGTALTMDLYLDGPVVVLYLSSSCWTCKAVRDQEAEILRLLPGIRVVYVFGRYVTEVPEYWKGTELEIFRDSDGVLFTLLGLGGTPSMAVLGADGLLAAGPVIGEPVIMDTIREISEVLGLNEGA